MGVWNVQSINGKEEELGDKFERINMTVVGVTETKKKRKG